MSSSVSFGLKSDKASASRRHSSRVAIASRRFSLKLVLLSSEADSSAVRRDLMDANRSRILDCDSMTG
jgi:hypothetical protein